MSNRRGCDDDWTNSRNESPATGEQAGFELVIRLRDDVAVRLRRLCLIGWRCGVDWHRPTPAPATPSIGGSGRK